MAVISQIVMRSKFLTDKVRDIPMFLLEIRKNIGI